MSRCKVVTKLLFTLNHIPMMSPTSVAKVVVAAYLEQDLIELSWNSF